MSTYPRCASISLSELKLSSCTYPTHGQRSPPDPPRAPKYPFPISHKGHPSLSNSPHNNNLENLILHLSNIPVPTSLHPSWSLSLAHTTHSPIAPIPSPRPQTLPPLASPKVRVYSYVSLLGLIFITGRSPSPHHSSHHSPLRPFAHHCISRTIHFYISPPPENKS